MVRLLPYNTIYCYHGMPTPGCEWKSESQFIRQDAKRETIPSASIVCKNIESYVPCTFHMTHVLLDHVLDLVLGFYPIPDPIPRFEKK